jgi:glycosyltransferase involved in cell wall biosynthesis
LEEREQPNLERKADTWGARTDVSSRKPAVSIIVPFRNAKQWLRPCLESLLTQDFDEGDYEIVAVDNGSRDESAAIVREFHLVRLVSESRVGSYSARNRGVKASRGSVLAFTDADCTPRCDWLRRIMASFDDPRVGIVLGQRIPASNSPILALWSQYERAKEEFVFSGGSLDLYYGHTNNMAVRRSVFEEHGPFLERPRGSDTVFVRQVVNALGDRAVVFRPDARVRHLELEGPAALLRKLFIYGRSSASYRRIVDARPLSYTVRWRVFRHTVERQQYSAGDTAALLCFLVAGVVAWELGAGSALLASNSSRVPPLSDRVAGSCAGPEAPRADQTS